MCAAPCNHSAPAPACPVCAVAVRDARYGKLWFGTPGASASPEPYRETRPCQHLGGPTGDLVRCPGCRGGTMLKLMKCAVHGECTPTRRADGVAYCVGCGDYLQPWPMRYSHENLWPGVPGHRFNPSILAHEDGYLLAARNGWAGSEIYVGRLDAAFRPVGEPWKLELHHPSAAGYGREDPRLFTHDGAVHVTYVGVQGPRQVLRTNVLYARLSRDLRVERLHFPAYSRRQSWEKNHSYFSHEGELYCVYSIAPHVILRIDGDRALPFYERVNPFPWRGGERRGGASPVRVGDEYWHVAHDRIEPTPGRRIYRAFVYAFAANPPFRPMRQMSEPLVTADLTNRPADQYAFVFFPCGAVIDGGDLVVSAGVHDRWSELHRFPMAEINRRLLPVK